MDASWGAERKRFGSGVRAVGGDCDLDHGSEMEKAKGAREWEEAREQPHF